VALTRDAKALVIFDYQSAPEVKGFEARPLIAPRKSLTAAPGAAGSRGNERKLTC